MRVVELKNIKTEIRNILDALKQIVSPIGGANNLVKLKTKELKRSNKDLPSAKPFDFTEYVEKQKEEKKIDLGLFFELAQKNKIMYNQVTVNTLVESLRRVKNDFFLNGYFTLGNEGEIATNNFFEMVVN